MKNEGKKRIVGQSSDQFEDRVHKASYSNEPCFARADKRYV